MTASSACRRAPRSAPSSKARAIPVPSRNPTLSAREPPPPSVIAGLTASISMSLYPADDRVVCRLSPSRSSLASSRAHDTDSEPVDEVVEASAAGHLGACPELDADLVHDQGRHRLRELQPGSQSHRDEFR